MREMSSEEDSGETNADLNGPEKSPECATQVPGTFKGEKNKHFNIRSAWIPIIVLFDSGLTYSKP